MKQIKEYHPDQSFFLHFNPEQYFKPNSLEMIISNIFDKHISIQDFIKQMKNDKRGQKEYHPKLLLKIIFYSYATGVFSSREMETNLHNHLSYIFLASGAILDHSTICRFIHKYREQIEDVFSKVLYICWKLKLLNMEMIALDGTKIRANASGAFTGNRKQFTTMQERLKKQIQKLMERQNRVDQKEASEEYKQEQRKKIDRQKKRYENALDKIDFFLNEIDDNKVKYNITDMDCRLQKGENGKYFEGYNAQAVASDKVILSCNLTNHQSDRNELKPMMESTDKQLSELGYQKEELEKIQRLADAGYRNSEQIGNLVEKNYDMYVRLPASSNQETSRTIGTKECELLEKDGEYILKCPGGRDLTTCGPRNEHGNMVYKFFASRKECHELNCPYLDKCVGKQKKGSKKFAIKKEVVENYRHIKNMEKKMETVDGRTIYNQRIGMIERVFGLIKSTLGFRRFYHRGLEKVSLIWKMICTAYNIRKIFTMGLEIV